MLRTKFEFFRRRQRLSLLLLIAFFALIGFEEIVDDVFQDPAVGDYEAKVLDQTVNSWFRPYRSASLSQTMTDLTALGSISVIAIFSSILISVMITFRDYKGVIYYVTVVTGAAGWPHFLKPLFNRARPDIAHHLVQVGDFSFPSGHSFGAAAIYMALAFYSGQYARHWRHEVFFYFLGLLVISLVGISRIYLGVHYPTDVLGGIFAGTAWTLLVSAGYEALTSRKPLLK